MKKISYFMALALVCLIAMTSCRPSVLFSHRGGTYLEPSDKVITKNYSDMNFQSIDFNTVGEVEFVQTKGGKCSISVTAPDNYMPFIILKTEKGALSISSDERYDMQDGRIKIRICAPTLNSIDNSGVGTINIGNLNVPKIDIDNSGVGKLKIDNIEAVSVKIDNSGVGSVEIKGKASNAVLDCSGVGSINALDLHAVTVKADVSGVGGIKCYASEEISGGVSGVGSLKYAGKPNKKNLESDGAVGKTEEIKE
ncbi:head GIN domain-containing protein [Xylanibacter oryzae]|uniref:head GIN domain-containing protein n=1 Tax=Xylanibacter oryzae TaxID=185293 RepID=UPI0004BB0957|nr:head GIN domain-containing protein [Xylanibacter oryzae]